jgi:DNA replication and repair protein RecF
MILKKIKAENFRNIENCNIEFSPGVNILHGNNAEGKTNIIEGIYIFARGKSFRAREDKDLIKFGEEGFNISVEYEDKNGENNLEYIFYKNERRRNKNGYKVEKINEFLGNFKSVLFSPDDLTLVKGGPEERREFLNVAISQCEPVYLKYYYNYKKALENRNCLLKIASKGMYIDDNELIAWSCYMAEYASYIYKMRKEYIEKFSLYAKKIMTEISDGKEEISFVYKSDIEEDSELSAEENYRKILNSSLEREKIVGTSLFGIHRDEVEIFINGESARNFASQGQQRSIVLSMKFAEGEVIKDFSGEYPVFLFDDVLSELDERRKKYIINGIGQRQIIITSRC